MESDFDSFINSFISTNSGNYLVKDVAFDSTLDYYPSTDYSDKLIDIDSDNMDANENCNTTENTLYHAINNDLACKIEYELFVRAMIEYYSNTKKINWINIKDDLIQIVNLMSARGTTTFIHDICTRLPDPPNSGKLYFILLLI